MESTIIFLTTLIFVISIYLISNSKETLCNCNNKFIENLTNLDNIDTFKTQNYTKYKSLIFGEKLQFTNSIIN